MNECLTTPQLKYKSAINGYIGIGNIPSGFLTGIGMPGESKRNINNKQLQRKERRKEGNVLFNDTLNTFYLRLYNIWLRTYGKGLLR